MKTISKQYTRDVKALFPSKGKRERAYLKKLAKTIDEFCEENHIDTKQSIYEKYGKPIDIVYDYYSALDAEAIIKKIHIASVVKASVIIFIITSLLIAIFHIVIKYEYYLIDYQNAIFAVEEEIVVDGHWDDNGNPLPLTNEPYTEPTEFDPPVENTTNP